MLIFKDSEINAEINIVYQLGQLGNKHKKIRSHYEFQVHLQFIKTSNLPHFPKFKFLQIKILSQRKRGKKTLYTKYKSFEI